MENNYFVYIHINKINKKVYVGITKQIPENRWANGKGYKDSPRFWNAICKYGWDNFEHKILYSNLTQKEACAYESLLINKYNSNNAKYGYNLTSGGEKHYIFTDEVREKLSQQKIGEKNPMFGTHKTKEQKKKQSKLMSGGKNPAAKKVLCIETNQIYDCCRDAAEAIGKNRIQGGKSIARCAKGDRNKAYNYHWRYIDDAN